MRSGVPAAAVEDRRRQPTVLVHMYTHELFMGIPLPRPAALAARLEIPIEEWPYLDEAVLLKTRSLKVCMTCHCLGTTPG